MKEKTYKKITNSQQDVIHKLQTENVSARKGKLNVDRTADISDNAKKTYKQRVEELEEKFIVWTNYKIKNNRHRICSKRSSIKYIIKEAKKLREEISRGCGKEYYINHEFRSIELHECYKFDLCPNCLILINRLNKIIGDKSETN